MPVQQERLDKPDVAPARAQCRDRLVDALRIHVIAQDHQKRCGPAKFDRAGINPGERLPAQGPLAIEDRLTLDRPIDDLARRTPFMAAVTQQVSLAGAAVGGIWPMDPLAVGAGHQKETLACRRVAKISCIEHAPVELEPGALQGRRPGAEIFAAPALDRPSGAQIERAPNRRIPVRSRRAAV